MSTVTIKITRPDGTLVTQASGTLRKLALWRARWERDGFTAVTIESVTTESPRAAS